MIKVIHAPDVCYIFSTYEATCNVHMDNYTYLKIQLTAIISHVVMANFESGYYVCKLECLFF